MEVNRKFIAQFNRSFFLSKGTLKGARVIVLLYEFIALLVDYIKNWDGGAAFPRDFTSWVMLTYFTVVLIVSYRFTKSATFELSKTDSRLSTISNILFPIAFTSALFDTAIFWSLLYPELPHKQITFYIIHFYVVNLLIMLAECMWSLMVTAATRIVYIIFSSFIYVGVYFLWYYINNGWMVDPPHGSLSIEVVISVGIVVVYVVAFLIVLGIVAVKDRMYTTGLFAKEDTYHIIDSQSF